MLKKKSIDKLLGLLLWSFAAQGLPGASIAQQPASIEELLADSITAYPPPPRSPDRMRSRWAAGFHAVGYSSTLFILNKTWYSNFPKAPLHSFNDAREWLQVDKIGHGWSAYGLSRSSAASWKWAGFNDRQAAIMGSASGWTFFTLIELLDARSEKWGWSWSDVAANTLGSGLYLAQQLRWQEQRIHLKFSFHGMRYAEADLRQQANDLFGNNWRERMLKDYNGQTYWLSFNPASLLRKSTLPAWLNLAIGYGADGMFGGFDNTAKDETGVITFNRNDVRRVRQFYLSPDIDFSRIRTNKKGLKTLFFILNGFKFPAPTLMLNGQGQWKAYLFYF